MKFHVETIYQVMDILKKRHDGHECKIILGDNSSGKSIIVRELIADRIDEKGIYFIDAVNRGFDVTMVTRTVEKPKYKDTIIRTRIDDSYFNLKDSFNCYGTLTERIEQVYKAFKDLGR